MKFADSVEVEYGRHAPWVPVKKILIVPIVPAVNFTLQTLSLKSPHLPVTQHVELCLGLGTS